MGAKLTGATAQVIQLQRMINFNSSLDHSSYTRLEPAGSEGDANKGMDIDSSRNEGPTLHERMGEANESEGNESEGNEGEGNESEGSSKVKAAPNNREDDVDLMKRSARNRHASGEFWSDVFTHKELDEFVDRFVNESQPKVLGARLLLRCVVL